MSSIILSTLNARYIHPSLGIRYIYANMAELQEQTNIVEYNIKDSPIELAQKILLLSPDIIGFGVYIWNINQITEILSIIKIVNPKIKIILAGPEISYGYEDTTIYKYADHIITGEADLEFYTLFKKIINKNQKIPKVIDGFIDDLSKIILPYEYYSKEDIDNKFIYVETSRGCPYLCQFCLSSNTKSVKKFDIDLVLKEINKLWEKGARRFKFVDRTFNLPTIEYLKVMNFFLEKNENHFMIHFEIVPETLSKEMKNLILKFPAETIQFEIGFQSFNPEICERIDRKYDFDKADENLNFLINKTSAHLHTDLIIGLPGEDLRSISHGFNRLLAYGPNEIQVGILKRLKGASIDKHTKIFSMIYNPNPPYEILQNSTINFEQLSQLKRFARYWDLYYNSHNFNNSLNILLGVFSPFHEFLSFSNWLYEKLGRTHEISLENQAKMLFEYFKNTNLTHEDYKETIKQDYMRKPGRTIPKFLRN